MKTIKTGWTKKQQALLCQHLADPDVTVTYWCSDQWGGPANHDVGGHGAEWRARPYRIDELDAASLDVCTASALHGTDAPHRWRGVRVWVVALFRAIADDGKYAATKRQIIGEVKSDTTVDASVAARIGMTSLDGAILDGASLSGAILDGASLSGASLSGASLNGASLYRAIMPDGKRFDEETHVGKFGATWG